MSDISLAFSGKSYGIPAGAILHDLLNQIPEDERPDAVAAKINGEITDLITPIKSDGELEFVTWDQPEALDVLRHSTSHIMAEAVQKLFPGTQVAIGPSIENGFYYDFDTEHPFALEDLAKIQKEMRKIARRNFRFSREDMSSKDAIAMFKEMGENYKVELIEDLDTPTVTIYRNGKFLDLCRGPHLSSTKPVRAFKLLSVAGAYWRGDERNKMLQRIYGTVFRTKEELDEYIQMREEAKKRDHRVLGRQLDLYSFSDEVGAGMPIWHPRGMRLRVLLEDWEKKEHFKRGYEIVQGPILLKKEMWMRSGHFDNYRNNMYFTEIDDTEYGVKPMNCLAHMLIYKSKLRSYRDLPQRYFELGVVHRHEKSGVLSGLFRVRTFTQDDAHIICAPDQLNDEIKGVVRFVRDTLDLFGFQYKMEVSTRPAKSIGSDEIWEQATGALMTSLDEMGIAYDIEKGEGAFYGPKIDVKIKDCLKREWQCATIQCDFTMPERFDLSYIGSDNQGHRPVMIHRVILGSVERFIGILVEHFGGAFPLWLSPVQAVVMTVSEKAGDWAKEVADKLKVADIRVIEDFRNEKIGFKIREWQEQKAPYMLVIGEREATDQVVAPRTRKGEQLDPMSIEDFIARINTEVINKTLN
jgi:threonyl-tRNA synthetase